MIRMKGSSPVVVLSDKQGSLAIRQCLRSDYKGSKVFPMAFHECTLSSLLKLDSLVKVLQKGHHKHWPCMQETLPRDYKILRH
jgi:hypothetical protein